MTWVASPPSSRIIFGCQDSAEIVLSMHHLKSIVEEVYNLHKSYQKSSSLSPLQAKTGTPASARAAATSFWVEYMLHAAQRTCKQIQSRCWSYDYQLPVRPGSAASPQGLQSEHWYGCIPLSLPASVAGLPLPCAWKLSWQQIEGLWERCKKKGRKKTNNC